MYFENAYVRLDDLEIYIYIERERRWRGETIVGSLDEIYNSLEEIYTSQ